MRLKTQGNQAFAPLCGVQIEVKQPPFNADPPTKIEQLHLRQIAQALAACVQ